MYWDVLRIEPLAPFSQIERHKKQPSVMALEPEYKHLDPLSLTWIDLNPIRDK